MTLLSEILLPAGFLIHCLNVALASVVACAIAVVLSRSPAWSLPARHALLVGALAASLLAPLVAPLLPLPPLWTIRSPETVGPPKTAVATQMTGNIGQTEATASADWESIPVAETAATASPISEPAVILPGSAAHAPISHEPLPERLASNTTEWAWITGSLLCGLWFVGIAAGLVRAILCVVI